MATKKEVTLFFKRQLMGMIIVLLIEAITFFIALKQTSDWHSAMGSTIEMAVLIGFLSVIVFFAEDPFGQVCDTGMGAIVMVTITASIMMFVNGASPNEFSAGLTGSCLAIGLMLFTPWILTQYVKAYCLTRGK